MRRILIYRKIQVNWSWAVPLGVLVILLLVLFNDRVHPPGGPRGVSDLYHLFEVFLPLTAGLWLAAVPALERQHGVAEVHLSYPGWPSVRLLQAAVVPACAWLVTAGACAWITQRYIAFDLGKMAVVTAVPALALSGVGVAATALARHQSAGYLAVAAWWMADLFLPGRLTSVVHLYRVSLPLNGVDPDLLTRNLLLLAGGLWFLTLWLAHRRERWVR